jgi:hypothetical protein
VVDGSHLRSVYGTHEPSCGGAYSCVEKALVLDLQIPVQDGRFNMISNVRQRFLFQPRDSVLDTNHISSFSR